MALVVESHDNRGDENVKFGFLYFNDGRRCVYANGEIHLDATGGWEPLTTRHAAPALDYAREHGLISADHPHAQQ